MAEHFIRITDKSGQPLAEKPLDLQEVRSSLAATNGRGYWQSLEELSRKPGFEEMLHREFPGQAPKDWAPLPRREFVRLMGAALALAGLSGCAFQPPEKIVPYVNQPEQIVPGIPLFYATAIPFMGYATGLLAESHEGRPTKLEGNPDHSSSRGCTSAFHQAAILDLYDPDRAQFIRQGGDSSDWNALTGALSNAIVASKRGAKSTWGQGLAILTETITSPLMLAQLESIQASLPGLKWYSYEAVSRDNVRAGIRTALGTDLEPVYKFADADVILSLDCDFLSEEPGHVPYSGDFANRRRVTDKVDETGAALPGATMNRLYVVESTMTTTGSSADHRFPYKAAEIEGIARAIAAGVGVSGVTSSGKAPDWVAPVVKDLKAGGSGTLVCAGAHQPAAVHALAHAINATLSSKAVDYIPPVAGYPVRGGKTQLNSESLAELVADMKAGVTKTLVIIGGNPAYSAPNSGFATALETLSKVTGRVTLYMGSHENETSSRCVWMVPETHFLEQWGDVRAVDGELALIQPLIKPLYEGSKAASELLAVFEGRTNTSSYNLLLDFHTRRNYPGRTFPDAVSAYEQLTDAERLAFDRVFQKGVHKGQLDGFKSKPVTPVVAAGFAAAFGAPAKVGGGLEVNFRPDPTIWDGRFANNGWLQELPKPVTKTVWDNAVFVAPQTAEAHGWYSNQEVAVKVGDKSVKGAICLLPGQPAETLTLHLGYGREVVGKIGTGTGFNASPLQNPSNLGFVSGATVTPTGRIYKIATTAHYNIIAPHGKDTTWANALNPMRPAGSSQTKVVDNILEPATRETDMDGTHGRDLVRQGTWNDLVNAKIIEKKNVHGDVVMKVNAKLPTTPEDKMGVPITYPENPKEIREVVEAAEAHHAQHPRLKEKNFGLDNEERTLEGQAAFYPRETDKQASTVYRDPENNKTQHLHAWGMTIDLQTCTGCNACVTACQSENNISIVGKDQILMNRGMHWIRIDGYFRGDYENPELHFEPMTCQHCEKAPCAPVCPFNAVMNSTEGINEQVYNRCVGTKYCENNCPYKVRRFNFLQYSDQQTPVIQLMNNPDVTVRSRGVMEKCTYCIQRVNHGKFQAEKENRNLRDGEIKTACQQSCPSGCITFGDINDPNSEVAKLKKSPLTFGLLTELNTLPRTTYLAKFKNPNPELTAYQPARLAGESEGGEAEGGEHGAQSAHEGGHEGAEH